MTVAATVEAPDVKKVTVPPAPVLLNAVLMAFAWIVCVPLAGIVMLFEIKVTLPVEGVDRLLNTLLFIVVFRLAIALMIKMVVPEGEATLWPQFWKVLVLMVRLVVALPVVVSTEIPCNVPVATPVVTEIVLLLIT